MVRKIILGMVFMLVSTTIFAQSENYKAFKVDLGVLYGLPSGDIYSSGIGFYLEPKYNVSDDIALGLRLEWAVLGAGDALGDASISALSSYLLTGDYSFGEGTVRPYVGLGMGLYSFGSISVDFGTGSGSLDMGTKFGLSPRAGVVLGHFKVGLDYNLITGLEEGVKANYLALKVGFVIGGGPK